MKMKILLSTLLMLMSYSLIAQNYKVEINNGVDTVDLKYNSILKYWSDYLIAKSDTTIDESIFWNNEEKSLYNKNYDISNFAFSPSVYELSWYKPTIVSIKKVKFGFYQVKTLFSYSNKNGYSFPLGLHNIYLKFRNDGSLKIYSSVYYNILALDKTNKGKVTFFYKKKYEFNEIEANKTISFLDTLEKKFAINIDKINYFICDDFDDIYKILGFDIYLGCGNEFHVSGFTLLNQRLVFSGGGGEFQKTELVRLLGLKFKKMHPILYSGMLPFLSGESMGQSVSWHIKRMKKYLRDKPSIDLCNITEFRYMDNQTSPKYILGYILLSEANLIGGKNKVLKMISGGKKDEDLYSVIYKELGIKRAELDSFFRKYINEYND